MASHKYKREHKLYKSSLDSVCVYTLKSYSSLTVFDMSLFLYSRGQIKYYRFVTDAHKSSLLSQTLLTFKPHKGPRKCPKINLNIHNQESI